MKEITISDKCPDPQLCKRLNMHIHGRLWDIWNNRVLTPEKCAKYRAMWEGKPTPTVKMAIPKGIITTKGIINSKPCGCNKK